MTRTTTFFEEPSLAWELDEWPPGRCVVVRGMARGFVWFRDGDIVVLADGSEWRLSSGDLALVRQG